MHEALVHVDRAVRARVEDIVANRTAPAGDARSHAAIRQADAHRGGAIRIQVLTQRCRCGHQLERGAWRIEAVARPVQQRIRRVFCRHGRIGRERPGIARDRQQVAGIRIDHHGRRPTRGPAGVRRDNRGEAELQVRIDRQPHVARLASQTGERGAVRIIAMPQRRHELAIVTPDRQHRLAGHVRGVHGRRVIVEAAQPIFGIALDI